MFFTLKTMLSILKVLSIEFVDKCSYNHIFQIFSVLIQSLKPPEKKKNNLCYGKFFCINCLNKHESDFIEFSMKSIDLLIYQQQQLR